MRACRRQIVSLPSLAAVSLLIATISCSRQAPLPEEAATQPKQDEPPGEMTTSTGIEMVLIRGGEFLMGSDAEIDARPVHKVSVGDFYMDCYEITQAVYTKIMGKNPAKHDGENNPVERVRWSDAVRFCNARSLAEGLQPCYDRKTGQCDFNADGYRLPTEAEWEYAFRAGTRGEYYFGNDAANLDAHAWFEENARGKHHPVGQRRPNPFGLYDMAGNVREWCNDWYQVDYYKGASGADPRGPAAGEKKVLRGGAWSSAAESCSAWARYCDDPGFTDACVACDDYGFRCIRRPRSR